MKLVSSYFVRRNPVSDEVGLTGPERRDLWGNQVLNEFAYGYPG